MEDYLNLGGGSGISRYELNKTSISVEFSSGKIYSYSYNIAGEIHVENMKQLAQNGKGLNSYIMKNVKDKYD